MAHVLLQATGPGTAPARPTGQVALLLAVLVVAPAAHASSADSLATGPGTAPTLVATVLAVVVAAGMVAAAVVVALLAGAAGAVVEEQAVAAATSAGSQVTGQGTALVVELAVAGTSRATACWSRCGDAALDLTGSCIPLWHM